MTRLLRRIRYHLSHPPRQQTCKDCWRSDGLDFHVDTVTWNEVVAPSWEAVVKAGLLGEGWPGVLCLECFDKRAERRNIAYAAWITVLGRHCWMVGKLR